MRRLGTWTAAFLACFLLSGLCAAGQPQSLTLKDLQEQADDFARDGAYKEAVAYYTAALKKSGSSKEKSRILKKMRQAGKRWYIRIGEQIERARSGLPQGYGELYPAAILPHVDAPTSQTAALEKVIQLCRQARSLDIENQKGKDLERAKGTVGSEWSKILDSLWRAAAEYGQNRNQLDLSAQAYGHLNQLDGDFFTTHGPKAEYDRLLDRISLGQGLADEAVSLIDAKEHSQAASKLDEAEKIYPDNPNVQQARARIEAEESQYGNLKSEGEAAQKAGDLKLALSKFDEARKVHPDFAARDSLAAEMRRLRHQIAQAEPPSAKAILAELQEGLSALVGGDPHRAIEVLQAIPAAAAGEMEVHLQAYLGAAYSAVHLSSPQGAERDQWLKKAEACFRQMLSLRSDHQLSSRLFSPAIQEILERIRTDGSTNPSG